MWTNLNSTFPETKLEKGEIFIPENIFFFPAEFSLELAVRNWLDSKRVFKFDFLANRPKLRQITFYPISKKLSKILLSTVITTTLDIHTFETV